MTYDNNTALSLRASHGNSWARPRGAQLIAGYTVNTYSIIHSALARLTGRAYADYTTRIILSALSRLSWRAYARRPCYARHAFSGLAVLCRMPKTKLIGRPVPEIWPNLTRTDGLTDTTYRPTGQQPFCQYPAVSWELCKTHESRVTEKCQFIFCVQC